MKSLKKRLQDFAKKRSKRIDEKNRKRLENQTPSIICGNCLGGFIYSWLGLQFCSPFINLFLSNEDFISALENWDTFIQSPVVEFPTEEFSYPVGSVNGIKLHFMHFASFDEAVAAWERRKQRMNPDNMCVMFSNFCGDPLILERFEKLPFRHKVVFVDSKEMKTPSAFYIKGFRFYKKMLAFFKLKAVPNLFQLQNIFTGKRFIDQFDYVAFLNSIQ